MEWFFVDDSDEERNAFERKLSSDDLRVRGIPGADARKAITTKSMDCAGVLMDIELGNETGLVEDGLSLSAAIRAAQNRGDVSSFPIIRFSRRSKVLANIGSDPSTDALFDLLWDKDALSNHDEIASLKNDMAGLTEVYGSVRRETEISEAIGLDASHWNEWGSNSFDEQYTIYDRDHLRAGIVVQALRDSGLLIDESLLAIRLGVSLKSSRGWSDLIRDLDGAAFTGPGSKFMPRWWVRAIEFWWEQTFDLVDPLSAVSVDRRVEVLRSKYADLTPIEEIPESPGRHYWRYCTITLEEERRLLPVDPEWGVPVKPRAPLPEWQDPLYAALGPALRHKGDPRIDSDEAKRLEARIKKS
jgi:hypothetical protein